MSRPARIDDDESLQAPPISRCLRRVEKHGWWLASLVACTAGMACSSEPGELPLVPCAVEFQGSRGEADFVEQHGYDALGRLVSTERYDASDTLISSSTWEYQGDDSILHATHTYLEDLKMEMTLQYGSDNRLVAVTWMNYDRQGRVEYEYLDEARQVVERWDREIDGVVEETRTYTYNSNGTLGGYELACDGQVAPTENTVMVTQGGRMERIETYRGDEQVGLSQYFYDADGLLEKMEQRLDGWLVYTDAYQYDSLGNVSERQSKTIYVDSPDAMSSGRRNAYDPEGRVLTAEVDVEGFATGTYVHRYDCPDRDDEPGIRLATPEPALRPPPAGPRGKMRPGDLAFYYESKNRCIPVEPFPALSP